MSTALAIAAVTATLKDLLNEGLLNHDLSSIGSFSVTAQPPDRITTGNTEANQLNVFLYQMTPNLGWRNVALPSRDGRGQRLTNPPLALDLHYLISAYGSQDLNAEVLLGYAMQLLHETPVISREQLRTVLGTPSPVDGTIVPGRFGTLSAEDLADQVELIKITPVYPSADELSKLWTAMQSRYRPSMAYLVSVVLIQAEGGARAAPPVLQRGAGDRGPEAMAAPPTLLQAVRHASLPLLPALRLGDDLRFIGTGLARAGTLSAVFTNDRLGLTQTLALDAGGSGTERSASLPADSAPGAVAAWGVGLYSVSIQADEPGRPIWRSNSVAAVIAPRITASPLASDAGAAFTLTITCAPRLQPRQEAGVRLIFGDTELVPSSIDTPADTTLPSTIEFEVPALPAGNYLLRLRVDGVDSLPVLAAGSPPVFSFDAAQSVQLS
ncbi:DUF4255 domain-containing protein [Ideonella sp. DXS29W]|uniref:DUF4255 domain-containing protein n=1 Tax=Ideonella lacteola TaxID=2984193 RepID=A0ABU9BVQ6_9BURK